MKEKMKRGYRVDEREGNRKKRKWKKMKRGKGIKREGKKEMQRKELY